MVQFCRISYPPAFFDIFRWVLAQYELDAMYDVFDSEDAVKKFPNVGKEYDIKFDPKHHKVELEVRIHNFLIGVYACFTSGRVCQLLVCLWLVITVYAYDNNSFGMRKYIPRMLTKQGQPEMSICSCNHVRHHSSCPVRGFPYLLIRGQQKKSQLTLKNFFRLLLMWQILWKKAPNSESSTCR